MLKKATQACEESHEDNPEVIATNKDHNIGEMPLNIPNDDKETDFPKLVNVEFGKKIVYFQGPNADIHNVPSDSFQNQSEMSVEPFETPKVGAIAASNIHDGNDQQIIMESLSAPEVKTE